MAERRLKGINFVGMLRTVEREHGAAAHETVIEGLRGELGEALRTGSLIASGWYPAAWYAALLARVLEVVGGGPDRIRELARAAVIADMKTLFRIMRFILTPERALQQSIRISSRYIDGGTIRVLEADRGLVRYRFEAFSGYSDLMWRDFIGGIEGVLEVAGADRIAHQVHAGGRDGDETLEVTFRYVS